MEGKTKGCCQILRRGEMLWDLGTFAMGRVHDFGRRCRDGVCSRRTANTRLTAGTPCFQRVFSTTNRGLRSLNLVSPRSVGRVGDHCNPNKGHAFRTSQREEKRLLKQQPYVQRAHEPVLRTKKWEQHRWIHYLLPRSKAGPNAIPGRVTPKHQPKQIATPTHPYSLNPNNLLLPAPTLPISILPISSLNALRSSPLPSSNGIFAGIGGGIPAPAP